MVPMMLKTPLQAFKFSLNAQQVLKPISSQDAISKLELGEDSEDILNDVRPLWIYPIVY